MAIINVLLGLVALLCVLGIMFGPIATIIFAIIEGGATVLPGQKRQWKKTMISGIISAVSIVGLILVLAIWGIAMYALSNTIS